jgi:hypothetical protein
MYRYIILGSVLLIYAGLVGLRIARYVSTNPEPLAMPAALLNEEERKLFLTPRGKYAAADIAANGGQIPSDKFRGFRATHDARPQPGDRVCPITRTKANSACTWVVNGQTYEFCCPPCIAEFVRMAEQSPDDILPAEAYILRDEG